MKARLRSKTQLIDAERVSIPGVGGMSVAAGSTAFTPGQHYVDARTVIDLHSVGSPFAIDVTTTDGDKIQIRNSKCAKLIWTGDCEKHQLRDLAVMLALLLSDCNCAVGQCLCHDIDSERESLEVSNYDPMDIESTVLRIFRTAKTPAILSTNRSSSNSAADGSSDSAGSTQF